jgi:SET domain
LCNSERASDHGIGLGVFSAFSLVNHSCDPNVVRHNYGKCSIFRSLRRIPKGEQLVDSYGPHFVSEALSLRTEMLKSRFRFICICDACRLHFASQQNLPWSMTGVEIGDDVMTAVKFYLETGKVDCGLQAQLGRCISLMDVRGLRMCQLYFVLQQMFKVIFASCHSF